MTLVESRPQADAEAGSALRRMIINALDRVSDIDQASSIVLTALTNFPRRDLIDILRPTITDEVRRHQRNATRGIEHAAGRLSDRDAADASLVRKTLLEEQFFAGAERGYVPWGAATVDDHQARIDFLNSQIGGIVRTVDKHKRAVALIQKRSVICLYDLDTDEVQL